MPYSTRSQNYETEGGEKLRNIFSPILRVYQGLTYSIYRAAESCKTLFVPALMACTALHDSKKKIDHRSESSSHTSCGVRGISNRTRKLWLRSRSRTRPDPGLWARTATTICAVCCHISVLTFSFRFCRGGSRAYS